MAQEAGGDAANGASQFDRDVNQTGAPPDVVLHKLRTSQLFSQLSDDEFGAVIKLLQVRQLKEGHIIATAGGQDTNLYIIRKGRVIIRSAEKNGKDPISRFAGMGEVLNEMSFVTGRPNDVTIETASVVDLWYIPRAEFQQLANREDRIQEHLTYSQEELELIRQSKRFDQQCPGEKVLWFSRKHWWVFVQSLWLTFLLLLALGATFLPFAAPVFDGPFGLVIRSVLMLIALGTFIWFVIDYLNDYYVITDQRVIHRERIVLIYDAQDEAPVGSVQNVTVSRPNFIATVLDIGNITIETLGARANIQFEWVGKPNAVTKILLEQQARARVESRASERSKVRTELRHEMDVGVTPPEGEKKAAEDHKPPPLRQRLAVGLTNLRNDVLPRMRVVHDKDIIYRKHWLVLLGETIVPFLSLMLYTAALVFIRLSVPSLSELLFATPFIIAVALFGFMLLFWLVWQYEDWRNDLYILTPDRLVDYKRTPFGLFGTTQRTARLVNVQNVTATTKGFIDNLFNLGDVSIRTGGVDNELDFARVWNPRGVQREVVLRLEQYQAVQREVEAARRRREFIEWIGIYDELTRIHGQRPLG